jgi:hypothetical protein
MTDDKHIISALLDALENAYIDTTVFRAMITTICENRPELGDWEPTFQKLRTETQQDVKLKFSSLRQAVAQSHDMERALQQFLKGTSPKGPVH